MCMCFVFCVLCWLMWVGNKSVFVGREYGRIDIDALRPHDMRGSNRPAEVSVPTARTHRSRKGVRRPWTGWSKEHPRTRRQRVRMGARCKPVGRCFLGPRLTFPVCVKGTCRESRRGLWSAYLRAQGRFTRTGRRSYRRMARDALRRLGPLGGPKNE